MTKAEKPDLCIIGMDPAGYDLALAAAQLGARVVLVTQGQRSGRFVLENGLWPALSTDGPADADAFRRTLSKIVAHAEMGRSLARPGALGIRLVDGIARFVSPHAIRIGDQEIAARRFVLATGRNLAVFPADDPDGGLHPFLAGAALPRALRLIGNDAVAAVIAQSLTRAGIPVEFDCGAEGLLPGIDPEASAIVRDALVRDGILFRSVQDGQKPSPLTPLDLSRAPLPVSDPGYGAAGIAHDSGAIRIDPALRTTNPRVYAIGEMTARGFAASGSATQVGFLLGKLLLRKPGSWSGGPSLKHVPTQPGIVMCGLDEQAARATGPISVFREAISAGQDHAGFIKAFIDRKGRILGVTIVGEGAAALAGPWALAMAMGNGLALLRNLPAFAGNPADGARLLALQPVVKQLTSPRLQALVRFMRHFG